MYPKKIYFVRHAEAVSNVTKEFSYRKVDLALTSKGEIQAEQTATAFSESGIDAIFTSPLQRAVQTARAIKRVCDPTYGLKSVEEFREINVGDLETKMEKEEAWEIHNRIFSSWLQGGDDSFPGGESLTELISRVHQGFTKVAKYCKKYDIENVVIVSHGGLLYMLIHHYLKVETELLEEISIDNGSISVLVPEFGEYKMDLILQGFNRTDHLHGVAARLVTGRPEEKSEAISTEE